MLQLKSAEDLVDHLKHFRADNIVNDAEFIRVRLDPEARPWTILGQVFWIGSLDCFVFSLVIVFVIIKHSYVPCLLILIWLMFVNFLIHTFASYSLYSV